MGYDTISRVFHWVTAGLVVVMVGAGLTMVQEIPRPTQNALFALHKSLGPFVLLVVCLRLAWRAFHPAPPLPASVPPGQARAAHAVHGLLYLALLVLPVSGYVFVTAGGYPIELFRALGIPPLLGKNEPVSHVAETVHQTAAFLLIGLILLHVAAALVHCFVRHDGVLARMWPPIRPR